MPAFAAGLSGTTLRHGEPRLPGLQHDAEPRSRPGRIGRAANPPQIGAYHADGQRLVGRGGGCHETSGQRRRRHHARQPSADSSLRLATAPDRALASLPTICASFSVPSLKRQVSFPLKHAGFADEVSVGLDDGPQRDLLAIGQDADRGGRRPLQRFLERGPDGGFVLSVRRDRDAIGRDRGGNSGRRLLRRHSDVPIEGMPQQRRPPWRAISPGSGQRFLFMVLSVCCCWPSVNSSFKVSAPRRNSTSTLSPDFAAGPGAVSSSLSWSSWPPSFSSTSPGLNPAVSLHCRGAMLFDAKFLGILGELELPARPTPGPGCRNPGSWSTAPSRRETGRSARGCYDQSEASHLRADADELPVQVEQRSARIAAHDGAVGDDLRLRGWTTPARCARAGGFPCSKVTG